MPEIFVVHNGNWPCSPAQVLVLSNFQYPNRTGETLAELSGSVPSATSWPSFRPSQSESGLVGSVPNWNSRQLGRPSWSGSAFAAASGLLCQFVPKNWKSQFVE